MNDSETSTYSREVNSPTVEGIVPENLLPLSPISRREGKLAIVLDNVPDTVVFSSERISR